VVWFDAYVTNVDRTVRNPNLLMWHRRLWLIDHGASLYFHHAPGWKAQPDRAGDPFVLIRDHVLRRAARTLEAVDATMAGTLTAEVIDGIVDLIPDGWLKEDDADGDVASYRAAYSRYLRDRVTAPRSFVEEAVRAR
jgi:hypothetical protein